MGPNVLYVVFFIYVFVSHNIHAMVIFAASPHSQTTTTKKTKPTKNEVTISTNIFDGKTQIAD